MSACPGGGGDESGGDLVLLSESTGSSGTTALATSPVTGSPTATARPTPTSRGSAPTIAGTGNGSPATTEALGTSADECPKAFSMHRADPVDELASIAAATVDDSEAVEVATGRVEIPANAIVYPTPVGDPGRPDDVFVVARDRADWYRVECATE